MDHLKQAGNALVNWVTLMLSEQKERSQKIIIQLGLSIGLVLFVFGWFEVGLFLLFAEHMAKFAAAFLVFFIDVGVLALTNFAIVKWKAETPSHEPEVQGIKLRVREELSDARNDVIDTTAMAVQHYYERYRRPLLIGVTLLTGLILVQIITPALAPKSR